ncbi:hypothetical protein PISMIDRAFT_123188 [Pisolithus microcarpus 441]|uniref:Aminoglycoside phosphotransferase domain-containing protein n=1 Tax=Pisolithus microcarpus 441 TaxID=765257 RepID=A0A0C9YAY0_9AGAM|nr:hypothetical protein PISMIDRAFT_123188 [Pisolithus microcarpus 441]
MAEDDAVSTFSYDDEADPDTFSLYQLGVAKDGTVLGVVRVAAPAFPKDKLESEVCNITRFSVATLKYLASRTQIPVPQVYAWNSDASNPAGAEYIIMQKTSISSILTRVFKMPGVSADTKWDTLSMSVKERTVSQVTEYLKAMFALRFDRAGSLYLSSPSKDDVHVGPIVSIPFFRAVDGIIRVPDADPPSHTELSQYRGPFSNTTEYLQSFLRAELHILSRYHSAVLAEMEADEEADQEAAASRLELGERVLRKALELCSIDEESGDVTSLIDFEGATIAPLWECAVIPAWLQDPNDQEGGCEGGFAEDREELREIFWKVMDSEEWSTLYEHGKLFRHFRLWLPLQVGSWASKYKEKRVDERLTWAELHPGVAMPEEDYRRYRCSICDQPDIAVA